MRNKCGKMLKKIEKITIRVLKYDKINNVQYFASLKDYIIPIHFSFA